MDRQTQDSKQLHSTQMLESCPFLLYTYLLPCMHVYIMHGSRYAGMFTSCLQIQLVKKRGVKLGTGLKQDMIITIEAGNNLGRSISVWSGWKPLC